MLACGIAYIIFCYKPNIHRLKQYELRKNENIRFADQFGVPFIDADYDRESWFKQARGMEHERGHNLLRHVPRAHGAVPADADPARLRV